MGSTVLSALDNKQILKTVMNKVVGKMLIVITEKLISINKNDEELYNLYKLFFS